MFDPSGFFVVRTPLLPFDALVEWTEGHELSRALDDPNDPAAALTATLAALRSRLAAAYAAPELREALSVASPSLVDSYAHWLAAPDSDRGAKIEQALVRYFSRMAARSTPFGLCAGITVGTLDGPSALSLAAKQFYRRHARLDIEAVSAIAAALARDPQLSSRIDYVPNSSLYRVGEQLRYAEAHRDEREGRSYTLVALARSSYLDAALECATGGATLETIAQAVANDDPDVAMEDAAAFVEELAENQVLVSTLQPPVSGGEPFETLRRDVSRVDVHGAASATLARVADALQSLNQAPLGVPTERYDAIAASVRDCGADTDPARLFHVDLIKPAAIASLDRRIVDELARGAQVLQRFQGESRSRAALSRFLAEFERRYETREVPLVEALDGDFGIGFGDTGAESSTLLEGIPLGDGSAAASRAWTKRDSYLLARVQTLPPDAEELELDPSETIDRDGAVLRDPPDAAQFTFRLEAASPESLQRGDFRICLDAIAGPCGANMLGRFCHTDERLAGYVAAHVRQEEAREPDAVFAEVVHLPEGRVGNVLSRPALRGFEIVYLGRSDSPASHQIPIDDLQLSLRNGRLVLRSRRLNRTVHPRLTTAHNYVERGPAVYRFLCSLPHQDTANLAFDWGCLATLRYLPRVVAGRCILAPAQWTLRRPDVTPLDARSPEESLRAFRALCARLRLPRYFRLLEADNEFTVDAENALLAATFIKLIKGRDFAKLAELVPAPERLAVHGPEGRFVHEIVLPLVRSGETRRAAAPAAAATVCQRRYTPGSEWVYAKCYCGHANADRVLGELAAPLARTLVDSGVADAWFFARYGDPDWHVRVRIHGDDASALWRETVPLVDRLAAPLLERRILWKLQFDTYEREVERYGGPDAIALSEALFFADSDAAVDAIAAGADVDARWRLALVGMDRLLDDFSLDVEQKLHLIEGMRDAMRREHATGPRTARALGAKYRAERSSLAHLFDAAANADGPNEMVEMFDERSRRIRRVAAGLRQLVAEGRSSQTIPELCGSYLHMHANRLLRRDARRQELVLYDLLARLYESRIACALTR